MFKISNIDTRTTPMTSFQSLCCYLCELFHNFYIVSNVDFKMYLIVETLNFGTRQSLIILKKDVPIINAKFYK